MSLKIDPLLVAIFSSDVWPAPPTGSLVIYQFESWNPETSIMAAHSTNLKVFTHHRLQR